MPQETHFFTGPKNYFGMYIALPARDQLRMMVENAVAQNKHDIVISYGSETKTYTMDELLLLLGFVQATIAPERNRA